VAITLAQIGEFSFILAEEATKFKILPDDGYDILVACAIVSISLNPLFFRGALTMGKWLSKRRAPLMPTSEPLFFSQDKAVVVGFGPVGRKMTSALEAKGFEVVLIDQNIDTIHEIEKTGRQAIYGDASSRHILEAAGLAKAKILVITPPDLQVHLSTVHHAKEINPSLDILCRTRFEADNEPLLTQGVQVLCSEEETVKAIDKLFLEA
jgi:CPA2 family monovalent cation:H+ antiporter-2